MTESAAHLLNHPLGYAALVVVAIAALAFIVAAINLALTAKLLNKHQASGVSGAGPATKASAHVPTTDDRAIVAAIAAAVTATLGSHRIIYIGARQSGSGWAAQLRSRHHASHMPQPWNRN
jgi:hypothetical protein